MIQPVLGMVLKGYPRISETFIANEILLLEEQGFTIRIFSMRHPREPFCHDNIRRIRARVDYLPTELLDDFPRLLLPAALEAVRQPRGFLTVLNKAGERFQRTRSPATIKHLLQGIYLYSRFLRHCPEIVHLHGHFAHSPASVAMFAALLGGIEFSFTAHAKDIYTANEEQLRDKIRQAAMVVTCTEYNRRYLSSLAGWSDTPLHRVYHGIDLQLFNGSATRLEPEPPYRILTIARLTAKKGIPTILQSLALLRDQGMHFTYTLIGDGELREPLLRTIYELNLDACCRWHGTLPHAQVIREFRRADLFALGCEIAADGDRDGIPNVLVESLAMGVPAVGTTVSALPEIILDGRTGLLSPPGNPEQMAANIRRLLTDRRLRSVVIPAGQELVREKFDNRRLIMDLASVYCSSIPSLNCS